LTKSTQLEARPAVAWFTCSLFGVGLVARLLPLLDHEGRLLRQYPTEDGYLMLTLARNLALGNGMSTADGSIPSNGTQPLATLLWSCVFALTGGDKVTSVAWILLLQCAFGIATAFLLYCFATQVFGNAPGVRARAALAAAIWFASPLVLPHTMNCLETGLYGACLAAVFVVLFRSPRDATRLQLRKWLAVGSLLGLSFWARNDAVLVCVALAIVHLVWGMPNAPAERPLRFAQLSVAGAVVTLIASPWIAFNYVAFGSIVPISGLSESMDVAFGTSLPKASSSLLEYLTMVLPIPERLEHAPMVIALTSLACALALYLGVRRALRLAPKNQSVLWFSLTLSAVFVAFYGFYFGAPHFVSRYLFVLSLLICLAWASLAYASFQWLLRRDRAWVGHAALASVLALSLGLHARDYVRGKQHQHFQVVDWVRENIPETVWVGAVQTGTLGYFHDRTINLDGKVNPAALRARRERRVPEYVVQSPIQYRVDWEGIAAGSELPALARVFELTVADSESNLGVLRRKPRSTHDVAGTF
jgi:hypothetical protein